MLHEVQFFKGPLDCQESGSGDERCEGREEVSLPGQVCGAWHAWIRASLLRAVWGP